MRIGSSSIWTARAWPGSGRNSIYGNDVPTSSSVSQCSIASCDGFEPSSPIAPVVNGLSSGTAALPRSGFTIGAPRRSATASSSVAAPRAPRPARMTIFFPALSSCAARNKSLASGSRAPNAHTSEVWCGMFRLECFLSTSASCKSTGNVMCETLR